MTNEMIERLESKGFKRWQKNGMDRLYIDYNVVNDWADKNLEISLYAWMNRAERQNGKMWVNVETGEIETKGIASTKEVAEIVAKYIEA